MIIQLPAQQSALARAREHSAEVIKQAMARRKWPARKQKALGICRNIEKILRRNSAVILLCGVTLVSTSLALKYFLTSRAQLLQPAASGSPGITSPGDAKTDQVAATRSAISPGPIDDDSTLSLKFSTQLTVKDTP